MNKQINFRSETLSLIQKVKDILSEYDMPLTIRQIYYRLVATHHIENNQKSYKKFDVVLSNARKAGLIPYSNITDRTRRPLKSSSWSDLNDFLTTVKQAYKRSRWDTQDVYLEIWLEKEALANIFEKITNYYDLFLVVGRGYQSLSALYDAVGRFESDNREHHILYFGDFDPTGEDIPRSIQDTLFEYFDLNIQVEKIAIAQADIQTYNLPPDQTKKTDSRAKNFVSQYGDIAVELDALPPDILKQKITNSIEKYLDKTKFNKELETENLEQTQLQSFINQFIK